jgi:heterodisulfide reductase subunit B
MMRFLLFLGCTIPARVGTYELAVRKVARALGLELVELKKAHCCGLPLEGLEKRVTLALAARILCLAEAEGLDLLVLCNGCLNTLTRANKLLKEDSSLRQEVNKLLREVGLRLKGKAEVRHLVDVLHEQIGPEKISSLVERPLEGFTFTVQYGCHLLRPSDVLTFDNPEFPSALDELVECLGAKTAPYRGKNRCCGGPLLAVDENLAFKMGRKKVEGMLEAGSEAAVTACPFCAISMEMCQLAQEMPRKLPVLFYPQLLGLALGFGPRSMGLDKHKVDVSPVLKKLG